MDQGDADAVQPADGVKRDRARVTDDDDAFESAVEPTEPDLSPISRDPILRAFSKAVNCEASYRYSIVRLGQLQHALRAALDLPPLPFHDPHGASLTVSDDGETLHLSGNGLPAW